MPIMVNKAIYNKETAKYKNILVTISSDLLAFMPKSISEYG